MNLGRLRRRRPVRSLHRFRRWLRRRFTPAGLALLLAMVLSGSMGLDPENALTYQVFSLLFGLLLASALSAGWMRGRFEVRRELPQFVTAGVPFRYRVRVRNHTRRTQRGLMVLEEVGPAWESPVERALWRRAERRRLRSFRPMRRPRRLWRLPQLCQGPLPPLAPGQTGTVTLEAVVWRRGLLEMDELALGRTDPLGLVRVLRRFRVRQKLVVLPRRYHVPPLELPGQPRYQPGGVALATHVGQSEEFVSLRDYRRGDPVRHIHWRSWAKVGRPIVKEFEDEFFVRHALVLDTFTDWPEHEAFEAAVAVAASLACAVPTQESLLDLMFVGPEAYRFTVGRGVGHVEQMLEVLASVRPCGSRPFAALEQLVLGHVGEISGCLCVLLAWDEPRRGLVEKLVQAGVPVRVLVVPVDPLPGRPDPGPLRDRPGWFTVLEPGRLEEQLAGLS
ncbi:DUF58 domain-containing protein [Limisphaera sp. 4302-co]|uniref:DUF58 domain-containing protein n=1 Tax=Limisphaera sp. 4302-co TaxID=3400417 RepID=UPI003C287DA5